MYSKQNIENHLYDNLKTCKCDESNSKGYKYEQIFKIYIQYYQTRVSQKIPRYRAEFPV